jgi:quercetin dioxygenase-like cupin family protein
VNPTPLDPFGAEPVHVGVPDHFIGLARIHGLVGALGSDAGLEINALEFEPGARTRPHRHDRDQFIVFLEPGIVAVDGGADAAVEAGHTVCLPANVPHMHGAPADAPTRHFSIMEKGHSNEFDCPIPEAWRDYREAS